MCRTSVAHKYGAQMWRTNVVHVQENKLRNYYIFFLWNAPLFLYPTEIEFSCFYGIFIFAQKRRSF